MRTTAVRVITAFLLAAQMPLVAEARDEPGIYSRHRLRSPYAMGHRRVRIAPPVASVFTPDLAAPLAQQAFNRFDDGYDYPFGYGEYAVYGRWALDRYGRPDVVRCRLVWFDGPRVRSLNRCD